MKQISLLCWTIGSMLFPSFLMGQQYFGATSQTSYDRWALGLNVGTLWVQGDIQPQIPGYQVGIYAQSKYAEQTILKINEEEIPASDFLYLYAKNYEQEEGARTWRSAGHRSGG